MATNIAQTPASNFPIICVGAPIWHTLYQTSTVPTDLNYLFEILLYNLGSVISIKQTPNALGVAALDASKILNSYISYDWQPSIIYSTLKPLSTINARVKWTAYSGNTLVDTENLSLATTHYARFIAMNGAKKITPNNWSYQDYIMNYTTPNSNLPMTEFVSNSRKFQLTDFATLTTLNGYVDNTQYGTTNYSQPNYMIVDVHYDGNGFDYPLNQVFSMQNLFSGSQLTTSDNVLQSTSRVKLDWPAGPANLILNTGISTNPGRSFRHCYQSAIGETMTPATIYPTAHYHSGTIMLTNAVSYDIYWVGSLPAFTGSAAGWLANLEKVRVSVKTNIKIDCECKYDAVEVAWLNQMGDFDYFTFKKANYKNLKIDRKVYDKYPIALTNYTMGGLANGLTAFDTLYGTSCILNTDWVTEAESTALETLWTSPLTKIRVGLNWYNVVLDLADITIQKKPEIKLMQYTVKANLSLTDKTISL